MPSPPFKMVISGSLETQHLLHLADVALEIHGGAENGAMCEVRGTMGQRAYRRWARGPGEGGKSTAYKLHMSS